MMMQQVSQESRARKSHSNRIIFAPPRLHPLLLHGSLLAFLFFIPLRVASSLPSNVSKQARAGRSALQQAGC